MRVVFVPHKSAEPVVLTFFWGAEGTEKRTPPLFIYRSGQKSSGKGSSLFRSPLPVVSAFTTLRPDDNNVVETSLRGVVL